MNDTTKDDSCRLFENKQIQTDLNVIIPLRTTGTQYENSKNDENLCELIEPIKLFHQREIGVNKSQFYSHDNTNNNNNKMHSELSVTSHKPDVHNKLYQHIINDSPQNNENNSMEISCIKCGEGSNSEQKQNFIAFDVKKCDVAAHIDFNVNKSRNQCLACKENNKQRIVDMSFYPNRKAYNHKAFQKTVLEESPKFSKTIKSIIKTANENSEKREFKGNEIKAAKVFMKSVERKRDKSSARYKESCIVSSDDFSSFENTECKFKQKLVFNKPQTIYSSSDCEVNKENLNFLSRESLRRLRCERELLQYLSSTSETGTSSSGDFKNIVSDSSRCDVNLSDGEILSLGEIREEDWSVLV